MRKAVIAVLTIAGLGVLIAGLRASTTISATDTFTNSGNQIQSDGRPYVDGVNCLNGPVTTWVRSSEFFLRTVTPYCGANGTRTITLDFSQSVPGSGPTSCLATAADGTLNICGSNAVGDVRVIASTMFSNSALTGGSSVMIPFSMAPNFSGTDFELDFEQHVAVYLVDATARDLVASPSAIADLYQYVPSKNGRSSTKTLIGRYYMPFSLRVKEMP